MSREIELKLKIGFTFDEALRICALLIDDEVVVVRFGGVKRPIIVCGDFLDVKT